ASWKNRSEQGQQPVNEPAFYVPANAPPEFTGVLARALLNAPDHKLRLLPAGEATIEEVGKGKPSGSTTELTQYAISGLAFKAQRVWLDAKGGNAAILSPWFSIIPGQSEPAIAELQKEQQKSENGWSEWVAREVTRVPQVD